MRGSSSGARRVRPAKLVAALTLALVAISASAALAGAGGVSQTDRGSASPSSRPLEEIETERTATSQTFHLPDGGRETRLFTSPVNYRDARGEWQPIKGHRGNRVDFSGGAALDCTIVSTPAGAPSQCGLRGATRLKVQAKFGASSSIEEAHSLLRFDFSTIPSNAYVKSAQMNLFAKVPTLASNVFGPGSVSAARVTASWNDTVTWLKRSSNFAGNQNWLAPGGDSAQEEGVFHAEYDCGEGGCSEEEAEERLFQPSPWRIAGLKRLVTDWVKGVRPNHGLLLVNETCTLCNRLAEFSSSAEPETAKRPQLSVTYYPAAPESSRVVSPKDGMRTARRTQLRAAWTKPGITGVTFQMKRPGFRDFEDIPSRAVADAGGRPVQWPLPVQGNESEPLYLDLQQVAADDLQIRALFEGPVGAGGYSTPVTTTLDIDFGGPRDSTIDAGPGAVDLMTGNFTLSRSDVSISSFGTTLDFSRTYSSRSGRFNGFGENENVLGAQWQPGVPVVEAGGTTWREAREVSETENIEGEAFTFTYALLTDIEGNEVAFEKVNGRYETPPEATGFELTAEGTDRLILADPDGNRTAFARAGTGAFVPVSISMTGGNGNATTMVYEFVGGKRRLKMVIAPSPEPILCSEQSATSIPGCRALLFTYLPATSWGAPASFKDRLAKIEFVAPGTGSPSVVAQYSYNQHGRLVEVSDPRVSPALVEKYSYHPTTGYLETVTPPGELPWTLEYRLFGRLGVVKRASLMANPTTAQTSFVYGVPVQGVGAPYEMGANSVGHWGQTDIPTDATAVFPPDEVPRLDLLDEEVLPTSYARATVYYLDAEGQLVNTATPAGAGTEAATITTTETDEFGNVTRELTPQNRLRALAAGSDSAARSHELETKRLFSADGTQMEEEWGPLHQLTLESGTETQGRMHRVVQYDQGAPTPPAGMPMPHLPTREIVGASIPGNGVDADQRVTENRFDWNLRKMTDTIVDPSGLNLRSHTSYDPVSGLPTEMRLPANPNGGDAHTTKIVYFAAGAGPATVCQNNAFANLPCKIMPGGEPETPGQPKLPVRRIKAYSPLGLPTEVVESAGGIEGANARTTRIGYDGAGRPLTTQLLGGGASVPKVEMKYSPSTGLPTSKSFICELSKLTDGETQREPDFERPCQGFDKQEVSSTYDDLGRLTSYRDADGGLSKTEYDLLGRPSSLIDPKGTQVRRYDPVTGLLVELQDSGAGTFTASYDADGRIVERGLPNGLAVRSTYDPAGAEVDLRYDKVTNCAANCTWLQFAGGYSVHDQMLTSTSTHSSQQFSYDKAGRLSFVRDTPAGGGCTTRSYSYDRDSNRTALVTRGPGVGGICQVNSVGTTQTYSYDAGDRLLGNELNYDDFGRITQLPGALAGGQALTTRYFSTDLVAEQSQGGITHTFSLDAAMRQRQVVHAGGLAGSEVLHYSDDSDSPSWVSQPSGAWTRNVSGIADELIATQKSTGQVELQLSNLHGDVVATAAADPAATTLKETFEFDEFGNPKQSTTHETGWLGEAQRRTQFSSGVIQMGLRSYVPAIGRFTSMDPVPGGSANAYDYVNQDPVNVTDLNGDCPWCVVGLGIALREGVKLAARSAARAAPQVARVLRAGAAVVRSAIRLGLGIVATVQRVAHAIGKPLYNLARHTSIGRKLFGPGGVLNSNRYLRVGLGKHDGHRVFRVAVGNKDTPIHFKIDLHKGPRL